MTYKIFLLIPVLLTLISCNQPTTKSHTEIVGIWQITEITNQNASDPLANDSIPSLFIFTPHHYSMVWILSEEPQRAFRDRWNPTDAEKIKRYDSFVVNSGTYEIKDTFFTAYPIVARVPEFMGGKLVCEFQVEEDTLQLKLVDEYAYDGVQAPWVASGDGLIIELVRIEGYCCKENYSVLILSYESGTKIQTIKEVREVTGLGLADAKALVEEMPSTILKDLSKWKAERIKRKLEESGLEVEIRRH